MPSSDRGAIGSPVSIAIAFLFAVPYTCAWSFSSIWSREASPRGSHPLLSSRASTANSSFIPAPISVSPSQYWDGIDGPWSSFAIEVGHLAQNIRVMPGTAATTTWTIAAGGCPAAYGPRCINSRGFIFQPNESLTWVPNSIYDIDTEVNLGMDTTGNVGFDTVALGWQGTGGPTVEHSTVFSLDSSLYWLGVLGLDPRPTNFTTFADPQPSLMQELINSTAIPSLSYGYTAGNQYRLEKVFGSLTLGGYDQNRFKPTNITFPFYQDQSRDLSVNLHSITTDSGSPSNLLPDGTISILVDSTVAGLWLPESACTAFEQAFGLKYDTTSGYYLVNSSLHDSLTSMNPSVTFTIGPEISGGPTVDIVLPYGAFDLKVDFPIIENPNSSYYFPLQKAANDTQYTLGRTFLQEAYLIADYDRQNFTIAPCVWDQSQISSQHLIPILRESEETTTNVSSGISSGAIAGIVVGAIAVIAIVGGILFYFCVFKKRRAAKKQKLAESEAKNAEIENKPAMEADSKPTEELGGGEIHEAYAPHKEHPQEMDSPFKLDPNQSGYAEMGGSGGYFAPGRGPSEVHGDTPVFEMQGSDVHEMPVPGGPDDKK